MTFAMQPSEINRIRMVVFDIDGTLADTADLVPNDQRRKPDDILKLLGSSSVHLDLTRISNIRRMTSNFNRCGIRVAVVSSSPKAYAGTVCYLLGVEADTIIAANNKPELRTKADRLRWLASTPKWQYLDASPGIALSEILYVGDLSDDSDAAKEAGCRYQHIDSYINDRSKSTPLSVLEKLCEEIVSTKTPKGNDGLIWQQKRFYVRKNHQQEVIDNLNLSNFTIDMNIPGLMLDPDELPGVINPFDADSPIQTPMFDPSFVTRDEYVTDRSFKSNLFVAIAQEHSAQRQFFSKDYPHLAKTQVFAHLKYWDSKLGQELWKHIKNWQNMESGPEVNLLHLEFIALMMASSIWSQHDLHEPSLSYPAIVPIPSSPYSAKRPARASNRLARRISQLTDLPFEEALEKRDGRIVISDDVEFSFKSVILIDDQLTQGKSAEKAIAALGNYVENIELRVWSSKHFKAEDPRDPWADDFSQTANHSNIDYIKLPESNLVKAYEKYDEPINKDELLSVFSTDRIIKTIRDLDEPEIASNLFFENFHFDSSSRTGTLTLRVKTSLWATKSYPFLAVIEEVLMKETGIPFSLRIQIIGAFGTALESWPRKK